MKARSDDEKAANFHPLPQSVADALARALGSMPSPQPVN